MSSGKHYWEVTVHHKGDEMWIGVGTSKSLPASSAIRRHSQSWAYYDGRRGLAFEIGGRVADKKPAKYSSGDTVGIMIDCDAGLMKVYRNNTLESECNTLPKGKELYPYFALDAANDKISLDTLAVAPADCDMPAVQQAAEWTLYRNKKKVGTMQTSCGPVQI